MKNKVTVVILTFALLCICLVGCGEKEMSLKSGALTTTSDKYEQWSKNYYSKMDVGIEYYDSMSQMILALNRGDVDYIGMPLFTAQYIMLQDDSVTLAREFDEYFTRESDVCGLGMMFKEENQSLCDQFNKAIEEIVSEGVGEQLYSEYIQKVLETGKLQIAPQIPQYPGADTVTIAITGDLPPLDYVDEEGNPSGYNVALLAEIAKKLEININLISIESGARVIALESDKCDACFWTIITPDMAEVNKDLNDNDIAILTDAGQKDVPDGYIVTRPYEYYICAGLIKKK